MGWPFFLFWYSCHCLRYWYTSNNREEKKHKSRWNIIWKKKNTIHRNSLAFTQVCVCFVWSLTSRRLDDSFPPPLWRYISQWRPDCLPSLPLIYLTIWRCAVCSVDGWWCYYESGDTTGLWRCLLSRSEQTLQWWRYQQWVSLDWIN